MLRVLFVSAVVFLLAVGCGPAAGAQAGFLPTPYLPTLAPTPEGLSAPTPLPPPSPTGAPTDTPTEGPTSSAQPTQTPSITPTILPQAFSIAVTDSQIAPSQITVSQGRFVRIMVQNLGSAEYELQVQNLKPDNILADESMAGGIPVDQLGKVNDDASNGVIHLFAMPQGTASATFTVNQKGTFPFTVGIAGHQLTGNIIVQ